MLTSDVFLLVFVTFRVAEEVDGHLGHDQLLFRTRPRNYNEASRHTFSSKLTLPLIFSAIDSICFHELSIKCC